jgi:hypothetical protein
LGKKRLEEVQMEEATRRAVLIARGEEEEMRKRRPDDMYL